MLHSKGIERCEIMGDWYEEINAEEIMVDSHFQDWVLRQSVDFFLKKGIIPNDAMCIEAREKISQGFEPCECGRNLIDVEDSSYCEECAIERS